MNDWRDTYPEAIGSTEMLTRFEELSAEVLSNRSAVVVETGAGDVVVMSAAEYRSIMETLHVFSTTTNSNRVLAGVARAGRNTISMSETNTP